MPTSNCIVCGSPFEPSRADATYCSAKCRQAALRDRAKSEATVRIGGLVAPCERFESESGAFGTVGCASIRIATLRGQPQRDAAQRTPVELYVAGVLQWSGDVLHLTRELASGAVDVECEDYMGRLAAQPAAGGHAQNCDGYSAAAAAAAECGLHYTPPDVRGHPVPLRLLAESDDAGGPASARDVLLWASRVTGEQFAVLNDSTLVFGGAPAAPRAIAADNVRITTFERGAPAAAIVWSTPPIPAGAGTMLRSGRVADVPPGIGCYFYPLFGRREVELVPLADRLAAQIARGVVTVQGETADAIEPHELVTVEGVHWPLIVTSVHRVFSDGVLVTRFEAVHFPQPPRVPSIIGAGDSVRTLWPGSAQPAQPVEAAA